jgi:UDP-glucose 4-epimerase
LIFSSSAAVYGNPTRTPITEDADTSPSSPYGWTKLAVDAAIGQQCHASHLGAASLRYFNVAGASWSQEGRPLGERHDPETHLIPLAFDVAAGRREHLNLFGDDYQTPDGSCIRDYIHVEDLARAHLLALDHTRPGEHQIYNLGSGSGHSNRQVIEAVRTVTGQTVSVSVAPRREGDPAILVASSQHAEEHLGWIRTKPDLQTIVADAWQFYQQQGT